MTYGVEHLYHIQKGHSSYNPVFLGGKMHIECIVPFCNSNVLGIGIKIHPFLLPGLQVVYKEHPEALQ